MAHSVGWLILEWSLDDWLFDILPHKCNSSLCRYTIGHRQTEDWEEGIGNLYHPQCAWNMIQRQSLKTVKNNNFSCNHFLKDFTAAEHVFHKFKSNLIMYWYSIGPWLFLLLLLLLLSIPWYSLTKTGVWLIFLRYDSTRIWWRNCVVVGLTRGI